MKSRIFTTLAVALLTLGTISTASAQTVDQPKSPTHIEQIDLMYIDPFDLQQILGVTMIPVGVRGEQITGNTGLGSGAYGGNFSNRGNNRGNGQNFSGNGFGSGQFGSFGNGAFGGNGTSGLGGLRF